MAIINNKKVNVSTGETLTVTEKNGEITVNSDLYNNDETYSKQIDSQLMAVFTSIGQSYN